MVSAAHTQKLSILIVDDHLLLRQGLKQVLSHEFRDLAFGEAKSSHEAIAHIHLQPWRLVILDIGLPDSDGFVVLQEVRARRPETAVLMLSMHADSLYAARSLRLGAAGDLSDQECKVMLLIADGRRTGEIAAELNLSAKTVSTYKLRVLNKLGLTSTSDLVRYA